MQIVQVRYNETYAKCARGQEPLPSAPCEPGALATDASGADISGDVLVCPPKE